MHGLLYGDQQQNSNKSSKRGLNGPFIGSEDNLDKKPSAKKMMPEIVISPYTIETTNKNFSPSNPMFNNDKAVRFKDDGQNELPNLMPEFENDLDNSIVNSSDLRGLKDAVNYFNKTAVKKPNKSQASYNSNMSNRSISNGQPQLPQQRYTNNPLNQEIIMQNDEEPPKEIIYAISSSYAQPGIQASISDATDIKKRPVDENIYSQVVASSIRRGNKPQVEIEQAEQPVYMNTPYNLAQQQQQQQQNSVQPGSSRTSSRNFNQWNDSSL